MKVAYKSEDYEAAMTSAGQYEAAGNWFWIDHAWVCAGKVPVNRASVGEMQRRYFADPSSYPFTIVVAVASAEVASAELERLWGALKRVSPEEMDYALLFAIRDAILEKQPESVLRPTL